MMMNSIMSINNADLRFFYHYLNNFYKTIFFVFIQYTFIVNNIPTF